MSIMMSVLAGMTTLTLAYGAVPIDTIRIADLPLFDRIAVCGVLGLEYANESEACEAPEPPDDWCAASGWYGDGYCDVDCPEPDPDCTGEPDGDPADGGSDWCADAGWYGDGVCDPGCPQPDPDCGG